MHVCVEFKQTNTPTSAPHLTLTLTLTQRPPVVDSREPFMSPRVPRHPAEVGGGDNTLNLTGLRKVAAGDRGERRKEAIPVRLSDSFDFGCLFRSHQRTEFLRLSGDSGNIDGSDGGWW